MVKQGIRILLISGAYLLVCVLGYLGFATYHRNLTGWFLILTALSYGLGGPFLLWSNLKRESVVRQERQDRSFWLILPGFLVVFYVSPLEFIYMPEILRSTHTTWMQIVGLALIAASLLVFGWARNAIKGMYSGRLRVQVGHILIQHGPYHVIRHPAYASYIIMSLGVAIGFSSLIGLLAVPLLLIPGLIYRINVEEEILRGEFGEQYACYRRITKRLIPFIW
jgi:protein-S-isoprenylcysteine O-methyltransferase Ste14